MPFQEPSQTTAHDLSAPGEPIQAVPRFSSEAAGVAMIIILVLGLGAGSLALLLARQREAKRRESPQKVHESIPTQNRLSGSDLLVRHDLLTHPPAESSSRHADNGALVEWPRVLPSTETLTESPSRYCFSPGCGSIDYAHSSIDTLDSVPYSPNWIPIRSNISMKTGPGTSSSWVCTDCGSALVGDIAGGWTVVSLDRTSGFLRSTEMHALSRRGSWPLQSSLRQTRGITHPSRCYSHCPRKAKDRCQKNAKTYTRWPLLGPVRTDLVYARVHDFDSARKPFWDDGPDAEGFQSAAEADSEACQIHRYRADPGPRAPRPISLYSGRELTADSVQLRPTAARTVVVSSPTRTTARSESASVVKIYTFERGVELPETPHM